mmetsp:Transcript_5014/g.7245  ORF Transcript_5014/g.7245 Transcript_5014/m.7245 type:complete len:160 (+) Transcript_5014:91-570(+)
MRLVRFLYSITLLLSILSALATDPKSSPAEKELHTFSENDVGECLPEERDKLKSMPLGAYYKKNLNIYMVGPQEIGLLITKENEANLVVRGAVPINDKLKFEVDGKSMKITMSQKLKGILSRYFVTLSKLRYDANKDCPSVFVKIFGVVSFPVKLQRIH